MDETDATLMAAWQSAQPQTAADEPGLARSLSALVERGRAAWPQLGVPADRFIRHVARHFSADKPVEAWLMGLRAGDLYLACACGEHCAGALETFDREFLSAVPAIIARAGAAPSQADEIAQRVRERLFVGRGKIAEYSGRGTLAHWLDVVTLRIAIDSRREERRLAPDATTAEAVAVAGVDPETELMKQHYREPVERALRAALSALSNEQRNLLKLHFVEGVKLEDLAALFHLHRATIVRRIAAARKAVLDHARDHLKVELSLDADELDDLMRILRSRLDISVSLLLV